MNKLSTYIKDPLLIGYGLIRRMAPYIRNDETYLKILFFLRMHKMLNLENPQAFSEKLQWLKLHDRKPEYTKLVDKYAVKEYVANIIGEEYVIPTIGVWDKPEDIDWDNLPNKFVLKTTHGGGSVGVVICKDKKDFDRNEAIKKLNKSLKQDIYIELREWPYKNVKKRIIAESFLGDTNIQTQYLTDYKFFCFNREPKFCQVIKDREIKETIDFFDMKWQHLPFNGLHSHGHIYEKSAEVPKRPEFFDEMKEIVYKLSKGLCFSRIDLYDVNGKIYFGEITLYPASGMGYFKPKKYNQVLGNMINLT